MADEQGKLFDSGQRKQAGPVLTVVRATAGEGAEA
jgi:hypothetical protein